MCCMQLYTYICICANIHAHTLLNLVTRVEWCKLSKFLDISVLLKIFYFFIVREGEGREKEKKRNINV